MRSIVFLLCAVLVSHLDAIPVEVVQRNIPVEVRYDQVIPGIVAREQVLIHGRRNLDAKVQLSADELPQALKHLPIQVESGVLEEGGTEEKLQLSPDEDTSVLRTLIQPEQSEIIPENPVQVPIELSKNEENPSVKSLLQSESAENLGTIQGKFALKPPQALEFTLSESQKIITNGLKNLRESFKPNQGEFSPTSDQWATLEKQVYQYFNEERQKLLTRQSPPAAGVGSPQPPLQQGQNNWIQNIVNGFNGIASNFVQSIQSLGGSQNGGTPASGGQSDTGTGSEQQPPSSTGLQGFIQFFNNGISNIVSTITGTANQLPGSGQAAEGPTTSNTNLSDSGTGAAPAPSRPVGFFGTIVTNVQNALGIQQPPQGAQGDTGAPSNGPVNVIQSVGNAITNFLGGGNRPPANAQGDPGTGSPQPGNANIIQNIQNAIQNSPLNPFRPQNGQNQVSQNPVQNAIQSVGQQVQQLVPAAAQPQVEPAKPEGVKKPAAAEEKPVEVPLEVEELVNEKPVKENEIVKKQLPLDPK